MAKKPAPPVTLRPPLRPSERDRLEALEERIRQDDVARTSLLQVIRSAAETAKVMSDHEDVGVTMKLAFKVNGVMFDRIADAWENGELVCGEIKNNKISIYTQKP